MNRNKISVSERKYIIKQKKIKKYKLNEVFNYNDILYSILELLSENDIVTLFKINIKLRDYILKSKLCPLYLKLDMELLAKNINNENYFNIFKINIGLYAKIFTQNIFQKYCTCNKRLYMGFWAVRNIECQKGEKCYMCDLFQYYGYTGCIKNSDYIEGCYCESCNKIRSVKIRNDMIENQITKADYFDYFSNLHGLQIAALSRKNYYISNLQIEPLSRKKYCFSNLQIAPLSSNDFIIPRNRNRNIIKTNTQWLDNKNFNADFNGDDMSNLIINNKPEKKNIYYSKSNNKKFSGKSFTKHKKNYR